MKKRILSILLTLALLVSLLPAALAEDIVIIEPEPAAEPAGPNAVTASGECGDNLTWYLSNIGTLTVSGIGQMWNFAWLSSPWYGNRADVKTVIIENGVTSIGSEAFAACSNLTSVAIGNKVASIGTHAFDGCSSLTSVTLPDSVTSIGSFAFAECSSLTEFAVGNGNPVFRSLDGAVFSKDGTILYLFPGGRTGSYTIPDSVTSIDRAAFFYCSGLTSVTIPESVTSIGERAFVGCSGLTSVTIPESVTSIDEAAFLRCSGLKTVTFFGSAPTIGSECFFSVTAAAYYPADDPSWTEEVRQNYGGTLTWVPYEKPAAPVLDGISTAGIALTWSAMDGMEKYELQRKSEGGSWKHFESLTGTACTDSGTQMGLSYSYRLRAYNGAAWGNWSDPLEVFFNPFSDVSGKKTTEYVAWAFNNGIVNGTSTTTFSPDDPCTRIQFIMMLWKMNGSPIVKGENPFSDISGRKMTNAILWALDRGIINSGKTFNPNGNITRINIVMMMWKLAGSPEVTGENPFTDVSGKKTTKAVLWAYQNGITKGTSSTKFSPDKDCTRVQLVIFLYKYNGIYHVI